MLSYWWNKEQLTYIFGEPACERMEEYQLLPLPELKGEKPEIYLVCSQNNRQFEQNKKLKEEFGKKGYNSTLVEMIGNDMKSEMRNRQLKEIFALIGGKRRKGINYDKEKPDKPHSCVIEKEMM